mmetsp:Transcript_3064/g.4317  ORF Transcript_3064/g.4317 Transcript_3064/m.4317 type:complete len:519 (+) Transcript_3064:221-1777(+)|eukprot:CAMPEP_0184868376 /NCGR_PEP_ID=MMETSP0580-20130426/30240_1 /TAXON_ID=1118495 /ORGANISM="Dactyliosolen fragilissimus" /LENGTH=518 /DNA_ID=CAMNT_0027369227 /DNA_START=153 /DNA_END=1709 /DNA_ORIENTATION=+
MGCAPSIANGPTFSYNVNYHTVISELEKSLHGTNEETPNFVHLELASGLQIEDVYDGVHDGKILGVGIWGKVRLGVHKATGTKFAIKSLDLNRVKTEKDLDQLCEELAILSELDHPNIVKLTEIYENRRFIYLVQELCSGGELYDRLDDQPEGQYTEGQCAELVLQMLRAVRYIHSKGIVHRDLKLENFLFSHNGEGSTLKMIDFGLSKHFKNGDLHHEIVGTNYTVAPETILGNYDEKVDIWAIGVLTYLLLSGNSPFGGCGEGLPLVEVRENILTSNYSFEPNYIWKNVSSDAKKFINEILVTDPNLRPVAVECLQSKWLQKWDNVNKPEDNIVLNPNVLKALVDFRKNSEIRRILCEVVSSTLLPTQIKELTKEFHKLDVDQTGEISLGSFRNALVNNSSRSQFSREILTDELIQDIFNAMSVHKRVDPKLKYHEFIAAALCQCQVDERNLKLAFEKLDTDHKGHITLKDVMNFMGSSGRRRQSSMQRLWGDSLKECGAKSSKVTYDEFKMLVSS